MLNPQADDVYKSKQNQHPDRTCVKVASAQVTILSSILSIAVVQLLKTISFKQVHLAVEVVYILCMEYNQQYTCQLDCTNLFIARDLLSATLAGSFDLEVKVKAARVDPVPDSEMPLDREHGICGGTFKFRLP